MIVIKRNGDKVSFDKNKIYNAVLKAYEEVYPDYKTNQSDAKTITDFVLNKIQLMNEITVEQIQDIVENALIEYDGIVAKAYITYRYKRMLARTMNNTDDTILSLIDCANEEVKEENSNKNPTLLPTQRDYMAGTVSKDLTNRVLLPDDIVKAHNDGLIHFHDADYFAQHMHNCDLVNLEDMLQNGTVISGTMIEKPHSFATACTITTQIIAQVASNQYGGQSVSLSALAPFVDISRKKIRQQFINDGLTVSDEIIENRVLDEIKRGVQTIQYQIVTLMTTNGQSPFVTVFMYLNEVQDKQTKHDLALIIEEVLKQRYQGVKNEVGVWITPAFPKLIYVLEEDNIHENSPYWYLTKLAAKCTAKRLVPDYISEKIMKQLKDGHCFTSMGCRSFLSPWKDENGEYKFEGRFNQGVVSINLPQIAIIAQGDEEKFWTLLEERLALCFDALMARHHALEGTLSSVSPIHWQYGAIARLGKDEPIDKLLHDGYSTISLGYIGVYETTKLMTGVSHTNPKGTNFALRLMKRLRLACDTWKLETGIGFGLYGTPAESLCYRFAEIDKKKFGVIKDVTDKGYYTNSYHVDVREKIDAFEKFRFESQFQKISSGGAISYVEIPNLRNNLEALEDVVKFIYENIQYAEFNTKSDYCHVCGYDGEIIINDDLEWECPQCHNKDKNKMTVIRRTCGYLGENFWNVGKTKEINSRVLHL